MKTLEQSLKEIKNRGFTHMKFELEANFNMEGSRECYDCDGTGIETYEDDYGDEQETDCQYCGGCGEVNGELDYDELESYIVNTISEQAREQMVYAQAYNDGSVDTEYTFTVTLDGVKYVPEIMRAFREGCDREGGDFNTNNAGFHIAVLTESTYPCSTELNQEYLDNFKREVTRLLPALYHEATPDNKTRGLEYRPPRISSNKYSCISIHEGSMEYRLFDPCFDTPEQVFEYVKVIANTLRYYSNRKLKKNLYDKFEINGELERQNSLGVLYKTPDNIKALQNTLKYVNPDGKLKIRIPSNKKQLKTKYAEQIRLVANYQKYVDAEKRDWEQRLRRDWVDLAVWQKQVKKLSDLDAITAREYIEIEQNKRYIPPTVSDHVSQDTAERMKPSEFLSMYRRFINSRLISLQDYQERNRRNGNTTVITG